MTAPDDPSAPTPDWLTAAPDGSNLATDGSKTASGGCLGGCGTVAAVAGIVVFIGVIAAYLFVQAQLPRAPEAVPVAAIWQQAGAVPLPEDGRGATGTLTVTSAGPLASTSRVAVTVGLPMVDPSEGEASQSPAPADVLGVPAVRLSVTLAPGTTVTCLAPCELDLGISLGTCANGSCSVAHEVRLNVVDPTAASRPLVIALAGGVTAPLRERLPDGLVVDLRIDGFVAMPQASP